MSNCDCVKVTPQRLKIVVGLGCMKEGVATAEELEHLLSIPLDEVLDALDGLLRSEVVEDVGATEFYLTEKGSNLFNAIYDATGAVLGGD